MNHTSESTMEPLLRSVTDEQRALLEIVGNTVAAVGGWPIYQYVQAQMDRVDLDLDVILSSMPSITRGATTYSLARRDGSGRDDTPVKLSVAGMAHLERFDSTVDMFLRILAELVARRAATTFNPLNVVEVEVSGLDLVEDLGLTGEPFVGLLPDLIAGEPSTWHGSGHVNDRGWSVRPSSHLRRFRGVGDIDDYVARVRAAIAPLEPQIAAAPVSPLSLVTAFDYLNVVWRLRFGVQLIAVPSAERAARLICEVSSAEELDNRLSALASIHGRCRCE
jgi:hypothetical protein